MIVRPGGLIVRKGRRGNFVRWLREVTALGPGGEMEDAERGGNSQLRALRIASGTFPGLRFACAGLFSTGRSGTGRRFGPFASGHRLEMERST